MKNTLLVCLLMATCAYSQTQIGSKTALSGSVQDFSVAGKTLPVKMVTAAPSGACTTNGEMQLMLAAGASTLYSCTPSTGTTCPCTWVQTSASGASGSFEPANSNIQSHLANTSNPHSTTAAQVSAVPLTQRGVANGVATLGSDGLVPSSQLPVLSPGSGDVTGPGSSTANTVPVFGGTTGKAIVASTVAVSSGQLQPPGGVQSGDGATPGCVSLDDADRSNFRKTCAPTTFTANLTWNEPNSVPAGRHIFGGTAPSSSVSTREYLATTGDGLLVPTWTGATTSARCVHTDASGNLTIAAADCGTGSGSSAFTKEFRMASCYGATTGTGVQADLDVGGTDAPTFACIQSHSNSRYGVATFPESGNKNGSFSFILPFTPSSITMEVDWETTVTNTSLGAVFHSQTSFAGDGETTDPAWNTEANARTVAASASGRRRVTSLTLSTSGSASGKRANFNIWRDPASTSPADDLGGDALVRSIRIILQP